MKASWGPEMARAQRMLGGMGHAFVGAAAKEIERITVTLVRNQHRTERDPYGRRWKPKKIPNGQRTLTDTRKMRSRWDSSSKPSLVSITQAQDYWRYHQTGTRIMPRRMVAPEVMFPAAWIKLYRRNVGDMFVRLADGV